MKQPPALALVAALHDPSLPLARVVDAAAAEAAELLAVPFASRLILTSVRRARRLPHGARLAPLGGFDWQDAFLYRQTYRASRLEAGLRRHVPSAFADLTAVVTDVEIQPPPQWRYLVFRSALRRGAVVSLAPLDPRFWGDPEPQRLRRLKTRLRAALVAALAPTLGIRGCDEPGCFFDRSVDGIDALDAMETVGTSHASHPAAGRRFVAAPRALDRDRLVRPSPPPARAPRPHPRAFERQPARPLPIDVHWEAGPTAALEIFHAHALGGARLGFERRHVTPWAPTVRPPVDSLEVEVAALVKVREAMERALAGASFRGINLPMPASAGAAGSLSPLEELRQAGGWLYDSVFPLALERGLTRTGVFLELGIDELLLDGPFELMHDHGGFLALRHFVGRFVNPSTSRPAAHRGPLDRPDSRSRKLQALVVGAGRSRLAPGRPLVHAEAEAEAVVAALTRLGARTTALIGPAATTDAVYDALRRGPHLLHYSGHAELGTGAGRSRLLLTDGELDAATLARVAARQPPAVVLLNACEVGRPPAFADAARVQGLIDALLLAGSYVVAARWPVGDRAAAAFATAFYAELLEAGRALGIAVTRGRAAARQGAPADDLTWAAYVLYGDPKLALGARRR